MRHFTSIIHELRGKGLTARAKTPERMINCIMEWMEEDEDKPGITHFVADNISWWYPVDPKEINCAILQRENQSLASAVLGLGEKL